jgi:hypothetical protein
MASKTKMVPGTLLDEPNACSQLNFTATLRRKLNEQIIHPQPDTSETVITL